MISREAVEAVLSKHGFSNSSNLIMKNVGLVDDLLALAKPPSREELEDIFSRYGYMSFTDSEQFLDAVWRWASGRQTEKTWCKEIRFHHDQWWFEPSSEPNAGTHPVPSTWTVCPICQSPKPERG